MLRVFAGPAALAAAALVALAPAPTSARPDEKKATIGSVERKSPKLDELIPKDAVIEVLAGGFKWTEGPVWDKKAKRLPSNINI